MPLRVVAAVADGRLVDRVGGHVEGVEVLAPAAPQASVGFVGLPMVIGFVGLPLVAAET